MLTRYGVDVVTDLEAIQLWRSEWLCARVIETRPREAFRRGYELKLDDKKRSEKVVAKAEQIGVDAALVKAAQYERAFGGAAILPVLDGALDALETPLKPTMVRDVRALHVLEPRQLQPVKYYTDLGHPKFGQPEVWRFLPLAANRSSGLYGQMIHESRLVIFPGIRVSIQTQPGQREGWGDSELSKSYAAIRDYGLSWGSATTILHNFGRDVLQLKDWAELAMQDDSEDLMGKRMRAFEMANSTLRVGVLDAEDKFTPRGGSLAGLSDTLLQQAQYVAAATEHPVTVLMGMSPAGLNATGDMDVRNWYATIENDQTTKYKPRVEQIFQWLLTADGGQEPEAWSVEFRPLMTPSEKEIAETRKITAETDVAYVDAGILDADDVAESRWKGDTFSAETTVDWPRREKLKKEREARESLLAEQAVLRGSAGGEGDEDSDEDKPATTQPRGDGDGRRKVAGLSVIVEQPAGSIRKWRAADGTEGDTTLLHDYGYLDGFIGSDGEEVDVFVGPLADPRWVHVVHQRRKSSNFAEHDEDKVMLGWDSADAARSAYLQQYSDPRFFGGMSVFSIDDFKAALKRAEGEKITHADDAEV